MLGYLSADIICYEKRTVFRERSSRKTVSLEEQIKSKDKYTSIFALQMAAIVVYYPPNLFRNARGFENSPLWKRVIAWERSRAASGYGIIWGTQIETNKEVFSAECHSVDCSGDSKVFTELQIAKRSRLLF